MLARNSATPANTLSRNIAKRRVASDSSTRAVMVLVL
jgi:hypothetical protein